MTGAAATLVMVGDVPEPVGGGPEHCYQVCAELHRRGAAVHFLDTQPHPRKRPPPLASYATVSARDPVGLLLAARSPRLVATWANVVGPMIGPLAARDGLRCLMLSAHVVATLKRTGAGLVVVHHAGNRGLAALVAARTLDVPLTLFVHGSEWTHPAWSGDVQTARLVASAADHVIANSAYTRELGLGSTGERRVDVLHPGVDHLRFNERVRPVKRPPGPPVVLFVGQMHRRKGADVLARAIGHLPVDLPARFIFVGPGGSLEPTVRQIVRVSGADDRVEFRGLVSPAELPQIYGRADLLVFPTVWPTEGFGMVAAEAMACGLPVVASRIGAIPEVVIDGQTGLLFTPGDACDLAAKLRILLTDPVRRRQIAQAASVHAWQYRWEPIADALLADIAAASSGIRRPRGVWPRR